MRRPLTRSQRKARFLRALSDLSQDEFEQASGIPEIAHIENGDRDLAPSQLAQMCSVDGLTLSDCEELVRHYEALRAKNHGPAPPPRRQGSLPRPRSLSIEQVVDDFSARFDVTLRAQHLRALRAAERTEALELWQRIADLKSFEELSLVLSRSREFQTWAMVERLCEESLHAASKDVERAGILARLAVDLPGRLQVPEPWKRSLLGYAKPHQGNVFRIPGDFSSADAAFVEAWSLWTSGHDPDGLLDPGRIFELEASLRRDQGCFPDALALLRRAEPISRRPVHVALNMAKTLEAMGDYEPAIAVLVEIAPQAEIHPEPRLRNIRRKNLGVLLTYVGRHREAALLIPELRRAAHELDKLDLVRLRWLEGRVDAGLGQTDAALRALEEARSGFASHGLHYDVAVTVLETAEIHLKRGELATVQVLAGELAPIFEAKGVHVHALAALRLFVEAVTRQTATAALARRLLDYLFRARHDEKLQFSL